MHLLLSCLPSFLALRLSSHALITAPLGSLSVHLTQPNAHSHPKPTPRAFPELREIPMYESKPPPPAASLVLRTLEEGAKQGDEWALVYRAILKQAAVDREVFQREISERDAVHAREARAKETRTHAPRDSTPRHARPCPPHRHLTAGWLTAKHPIPRPADPPLSNHDRRRRRCATPR